MTKPPKPSNRFWYVLKPKNDSGTRSFDYRGYMVSVSTREDRVVIEVKRMETAA